ncbi:MULTISPECIES: metallophosphoesterase [unclassified Ruegeria]|uniref:metallophosphoesterase family protein n=1 Tax=unclassified Ruegeria TaxID=2625375 RepID=UPI001ADD4950|nr:MULTISPECIES: metallophosphoesterase [unclassified Ruegeria]MBO9411612.1 metallophosphoesterase family protein [Ruegeria sp. R8_1]MBO9415826.1 metallophosphoesterase family protein [Ruegeria sp. R8_2]
MRILAFSDLHMARNRAAELVAASDTADLVIGAGDFCNMRQGLDEAMEMLSGIAAPLVLVPGNAESAEELTQAAPQGVHVLHGTGMTIDGLRLFGLGYGVPPTPFGDWSCDLTEAEATELLDRCDGAHVLITHSPPKGYGDVTSTGDAVGSTAVRDAIERLQPQLSLHGHIHDSWGYRGTLGRTQITNLGPRVNWFEGAA